MPAPETTPRPPILSVTSNGDGTSVVEIGTRDWSQARVTVPDDVLDDPAVLDLYTHAANLGETAYTALRQSHRDQQMKGG